MSSDMVDQPCQQTVCFVCKMYAYGIQLNSCSLDTSGESVSGDPL
jgi:hypothetical protein